MKIDRERERVEEKEIVGGRITEEPSEKARSEDGWVGGWVAQRDDGRGREGGELQEEGPGQERSLAAPARAARDGSSSLLS